MEKLTKEQQDNVNEICRCLGIPVVEPQSEQSDEDKNIQEIINYSK